MKLTVKYCESHIEPTSIIEMASQRYQRIIEINGGEKISLPIVKFPPFKLRAAMVEKDPVIWLHLIETYNQYFAYLMSEGRLESLEDSTYENLCVFVRGYLRELSAEEGKLLSLGMNGDVKQQLLILRSWILALVKNCGLLHLQISCDTLWDFVRLYVKENPDTVRALIEGSLKPTINTQKAHLNRTYQLHQQLKQLVESGNFSRVDLKALECLLSSKGKRTKSFADQFLTTKWAEILESWFVQDGKDIRTIAKNLGILTYLSASEKRIVSLASELHIGNLETLQLYPLFGALLMNQQFQVHFKGLRSKLPFMKSLAGSKHQSGQSTILKTEDVKMISEVFPHFTIGQIEKELQAFDGNVERTIESLFEAPQKLEKGPTAEETAALSDEGLKPTEFESELKKSDRLAKVDGDSDKDHVPDEVRNKTLTRALALLYQADEDEKDDTYDDAEAQPEQDSGTEKAYEKIEGYLWELLKVNKLLFERSCRGSKARKDMKSNTLWSDEQIEGWARMLERSPKRAQLLEEKYMFRGNVRSGKKSFVSKDVLDENRKSEPVSGEDAKAQTRSTRPGNGGDKKRQNARNEKNKGSRANHNRKSGHDRKMTKSMP
ncbi:LANO_0F01948g1_1 [Lachancea nothofagi CBS 11611]|uniref:LANO_0F01948g1_1 n=1 Tax=Lachancea nothofagi CBS 11611 TaxID=1266666 RepID=A0A1G4K6N1_9SACH|nr:LANO_0F01948g1_1 [Lachancea nothofagi CBS 11611]